VIHGDLKTLYYNLVDMHKIIPKIQDVMKFQRWLIVKLILDKLLKTVLDSSVWTLEINTSF
jgi:hypothetical protein